MTVPQFENATVANRGNRGAEGALPQLLGPPKGGPINQLGRTIVPTAGLGRITRTKNPVLNGGGE